MGPSGSGTSTLLNILGGLLAGDAVRFSRMLFFLTRVTQQRYLYRGSDRRFEGTVMALQRFLNLPKEEKDKVLGIAKKQFAQYGYDQMSLNFFLKELGISKGQFYYWFEEKADLFFTVMQEGLEALRLRLEAHGQPTSKSDYWGHVSESRLITERFWNDQDFVEIGKMVSQQVPPNHPIYERLEFVGQPIKRHFGESLRLGQKWKLVRTDLSVEVLLKLTEDVSDAFYSPMLGSYSKGSPPSSEAMVLYDLLGRTLRLILQPSFVAVSMIAATLVVAEMFVKHGLIY